MHEYNTVLKRILTRPGSVLLTILTGSSSLRWLEVEESPVRHLCVDLLGESPRGGLIHIELQSRNEEDFPSRMRDYAAALALRHGRPPKQVALYVGAEPLRMPNRIAGRVFRFDMVNIEDLDGEQLMASENIGDNVICLLTRRGSQPNAIKRILARVDACPPEERANALADLSILAGLRGLRDEVKQERFRAQLALLLSQVEKSFGTISDETRSRLEALKPDQVEPVGLRLLDAHRIEDLFVR